jgi:23S rRNA (guanosine2251-2'-O)-methyltransferase
MIYGINAVLEALRAGRVSLLRVSDRHGERVEIVVRHASGQGIRIIRSDQATLDRLTGGRAHQGVVAEIRAARGHTVESLVREAAGAPLLLVLDGIEDPQNFGAILRTADGAGVDGLIRQTRHAAPLDGAVATTSAGAIAHARIADVVNIARAVDELKAVGVWTVGLAGESAKRYDELDLTLPTAVVVGAEGPGLRRLVRDRCDWLVSIPMLGHLESLNVSVAAGVVLYEAVRQRRAAGLEPGARAHRA